EMLEELRNHVGAKIGPIANPANIVFTPELPKTRSGKIMRRLLRDVAENRALGDTTTLADPTGVGASQERATPEAPEDSLEAAVLGVDRLDRSFQTDARAKPARRESGIASDA